jgi:hypothetical protein
VLEYLYNHRTTSVVTKALALLGHRGKRSQEKKEGESWISNVLMELFGLSTN